jgi:hypothetical protein
MDVAIGNSPLDLLSSSGFGANSWSVCFGRTLTDHERARCSEGEMKAAPVWIASAIRIGSAVVVLR